MKLKILWTVVFILIVAVFTINCGKKTTEKPSTPDSLPLTPIDTIDTLISVFNKKSLSEKINLYNQMIIDSQPSIVDFLKKEGCVVLLRKFAKKDYFWVSDIGLFENLSDDDLNFGNVPFFGIYVGDLDLNPNSALLQSFAVYKRTSNIRFFDFYVSQKRYIDILEIRRVGRTLSLFVYIQFKQGNGNTLFLQGSQEIFQKSLEGEFILDSMLFQNINYALYNMMTPISHIVVD